MRLKTLILTGVSGVRGPALAVFFLLLTVFPLQATQAQALTGNPERGAQLYIDYSCYACHGYTGETGSGQRLNPPRFDQSGFIAYVRVGNMSRRSPPAGSWMPAYAGDDVSDQELADIYAYVSAMQSSTPEFEDIDILQD